MTILDDPAFIEARANPLRYLVDGTLISFEPDAVGNLYAKVIEDGAVTRAIFLSMLQLRQSRAVEI